MCMGSAAAHAGAHTMPNVSNATAILGTARLLLRPDRCRDLRGCHFRTAQRYLNCAVPGFYGSKVLGSLGSGSGSNDAKSAIWKERRRADLSFERLSPS